MSASMTIDVQDEWKEAREAMDAKNAQEAQEVVSFWFKEEASQPKFILTPTREMEIPTENDILACAVRRGNNTATAVTAARQIV